MSADGWMQWRGGLAAAIILVGVCGAGSVAAQSRAPVVRPAKPPVFIDLSLSTGDRDHAAWHESSAATEELLDRIGRAALRHPDRVITIRIVGAPLAVEHDQADGTSHAARLASLLQRSMERVHEQLPQARLSVYGLPLEPARFPAAARANEDYRAVIEQLDALVSPHALILDQSGRTQFEAWAGSNPEALAQLGDRPVLFRVNGAWRVAVANGSQEALAALEDHAVDETVLATVNRRLSPEPFTTSRDENYRATGPTTIAGRDSHGARDEGPAGPARFASGGGRSTTVGRHNDEQAGNDDQGGNEDDEEEEEEEEEEEGGEEDPDLVFLRPGSGWRGPTAEPAPRGGPNQDGYTARAIARWDVVPYQTFSGEFAIGVIAFHMADIEHLEFAVEGGPWQPITNMTLNERTGAWEYVVGLRAQDFGNRPIEVRAIAYPKIGRARVLPSLFLYSMPETIETTPVYVSGTGSDTQGDGSRGRPYRNLWRASEHIARRGGEAPGDGAVIACLPGEYHWFRPSGSSMAATMDHWLTVQAAEGVAATDVIIRRYMSGNANAGLDTKLVRFHNVTFAGESLALICASGPERYLWANACEFRAAGQFWTVGWYEGVYVTDSTARDVTAHMFLACELVRNCAIDRFGGDAFKAARLVVNCTLRDQIGLENDVHSDIWQNSAGYDDNVIVYGVTATDLMHEQGFFSRTGSHSDIAIVNCNIDLHGYPSQNQWRTRTDHFVVRYNTFLGTPWQIALSDELEGVSGYYGSTNSIFENNVFQWVTITDDEGVSGSEDPDYNDIFPGTRFARNHFMNVWPEYTDRRGRTIGQPIGADATTGPVVPAGRGAYGQNRPPWVQAQQ